MWSETQQIYTTDDPTKHGKLTGLGCSVGRESVLGSVYCKLTR